MLACAPALPAATERTNPCRIDLCGSLIVEIGGRRVDALLPGRKGKQLFACLVIGRSRPISRDELIDVIWPTDPPTDPEGTLSTLLTRLRSVVGHDLVQGRRELVVDLGGDARVDWEIAHASVPAAERQLAGGDSRGALASTRTGLDIARRPLLPGISTPWVEERRRELMEIVVALLETSGRAALVLGNEHLPQAERSARELIEREPYRESGYALLMESHAARGNVAEALRVYDDLRRLLREQLGLTPAPAITALAERLLDCHEHAPASAPTAVGHLPLPSVLTAAAARPFIGRCVELERLKRTIKSASSCRVVTISGEIGIGKSRLAAEVAADAHATGCAVLHGRAQSDEVLSLGPFVEALRGYLMHSAAVADELLPLLQPELTELARVVPALRPAVGTPDGSGELHLQRFADAATAVLVTAARHRPLLLVFDDLHLADRETVMLLRHLIRAAVDAPVVVLATVRDDQPESRELGRLLRDLHRERSLERVPLCSLNDSEVAELLAAHGHDANGSDLRGLCIRAGGNPFYIEELLMGRTTGEPMPPPLRAALDSRLELLPDSVREVLEAGAMIGHAFDVPAVAHRTGAPTADVAVSVAQAVRAGLLVSDAHDHFAFRHGLIRYALAGG
ncbi:AAA family ATPase [Solirubrobacter taibaiensis]|nr:AAA family ATPase [Solirubrobacter taibaiensis]